MVCFYKKVANRRKHIQWRFEQILPAYASQLWLEAKLTQMSMRFFCQATKKSRQGIKVLIMGVVRHSKRFLLWLFVLLLGSSYTRTTTTTKWMDAALVPRNSSSVPYSVYVKIHATSRQLLRLSLIHIWRCRRIERCRSRWSPYH